MPQLISEATTSTVNEFKQYSWNEPQNEPAEAGYNCLYKHNYDEHCNVLNPLVPTYYSFTGAWLLIAAIFIGYLYGKCPSEARLPL